MKTYYSAAVGLILGIFGIAASSSAQASWWSPKTSTNTVTANVDPVNGSLITSGTISHSYAFVAGAFVQLAAGTTAYSATIKVNGVNRSYIVLRPDPAPASAPLLLLLHPLGTSPQQMANLTQVSDFVATQNFWAVMPAARNGKWEDNQALQSDDDVQFISALIDTLATQGVDSSRVYAAGYSDGAFMAERLACELSDKIAAFAMDAATVISGTDKVCKPAVLRPKMYVLGTSDPLVPYDGGLFFLYSATDTMSYWAQEQGCGGAVASTLPTVVNDGTSVQLTEYTGCNAGSALRLYTVENGGHAWPGGLTQIIGKTSQNLDATGAIWNFVSGYSL